MVLSEGDVINGSKRGTVKTSIGSRNVARGVGMWVTGYELSTWRFLEGGIYFKNQKRRK